MLHADLDAFFASVEQRDDPSLRGRPVLVGGGVIVAASYEAKRCGVKTPTNERAAKALCPDAIVVPPHFEAYLEASRVVFECFRNITPLVEGISIDEAFLDVRGARRAVGEPLAIAAQLRATIRDDIGLPISVGIASTKFLAKVASASAKPDGVLLIPAGEELAFLHPLPIERIWGVGPKTSIKLRAIGINSVGDLAALPAPALAAALGRGASSHLHSLAWNHDPRRVQSAQRRRSIGSQSALGRPRHNIAELEIALLGIVDRVARRLRADNRLARTITLRLRFGDSQRATRSASLPNATDSTHALARTCHELLLANRDLIEARGLTLIGLGLTNLTSTEALQLSLPFETRGDGTELNQRELDHAVDAIQSKFGNAALTRASLVRNERFRSGFAEPLYEH